MNRTFIFLGIFSLLNACKHPPENILGEPDSDYHHILAKHTVAKKQYGIENTPYLTNVTFKDMQLRQAYITEFNQRYHPSEQELSDLRAKEASDEEKYTEVLVFHFSTNPKDKKLSKGTDFWKVRLEKDHNGVWLEPLEIIEMSGNKTVLNYFYPQMTTWTNNYLVRFPKVTDYQTLTLHLDSVQANVNFDWQPQ